MNEEMDYQESILEDTTPDENVLSSSSGDTLEDKLDRVEALLNEEITKRETEEELGELDEEQGSQSIMRNTSSGVNDPNYAQYIYDLLADSTVKVEIVEQQTIFDKQLNEYTVEESIGLIVLMLAVGVLIGSFISRYTFKRR